MIYASLNSFTFLVSITWFQQSECVTTTTQDPDAVSPFDVDYELKRTPKQIEEALKKYKIIPDLLQKAPKETIYAEWVDGPVAKLGNEVKELVELEARPFWVNYRSFLSKYHTMLLVGLDEPSAKNRSSSEFQYWAIGNIPPHTYECLPATDYVRGETLSDYREPKPLQGSGMHRYVFLVYAQEQGVIKFNETILATKDREGRLNFSSKKFAEKYKLGEPYAVNFFRAQWQLPPWMISTEYPLTEMP